MAIKSFRINGKVHYGQCDYRHTPSSIIKTLASVTNSLEPGTLVLSGVENGNLDEIQIKENSRIDIGDVCLCVVATISQTKDEIVLMVTDYESMM